MPQIEYASVPVPCVARLYGDCLFCSAGGKAAVGLAPTPSRVQTAPHTPGHSPVPAAPAGPSPSPSAPGSGQPTPPGILCFACLVLGPVPLSPQLLAPTPGACSVNQWDKGHQNLARPGPCRGVAAQRGWGGGSESHTMWADLETCFRAIAVCGWFWTSGTRPRANQPCAYRWLLFWRAGR